jgi:hypothetical protein
MPWNIGGHARKTGIHSARTPITRSVATPTATDAANHTASTSSCGISARTAKNGSVRGG